MDIKRLVIGMVLAMTFVFAWQWFVTWQYERHPEWRRPGQQTEVTETPPASASTNPATTQTAATTEIAVTTPTDTPPTISAPGGYRVAELATSESAPSSLGASEEYPVGLTVSPMGAGVESVVLSQFKDVDRKGPYVYQRALAGHENATRPLATRQISIDGQTIDLLSVSWQQEGDASADSVTYSATILDSAGQPLLRLVKKFTLTPSQSPGKGYEVLVNNDFVNLTGRPLKITTAFNGPTPPPREIDSHDDRQILAGYLNKSSVVVEAPLFAEFKDKPTNELIRNEDELPLLWAGASSVYFNAIIRPEPVPALQGGADSRVPAYLASVSATALNPTAAKPDEYQVAMVLTTHELTVDPASTLTLPLRVFFGPKLRSVLTDSYYKAPPLSYNQTLATLNTGCANWCTAGPIINSLVWLLGAFHFIFRDWGLAIIGLVVLVRLALHPITKRSTISMHKMGKMGPEIERLKKKYGDNKEELNRAMMELYKEQGATPILGCLPMFLQMPIWIALWSALQNTFQLRQAPFLYGITWIDDLAKADRLFYFPNSAINIWFIHLDAINLLPILLAVVFYIQAEIQNRLQPAATPEQEQQKKMMKWMSLLFPIFLYSQPSGLNLYILTSTTIGIIEMKRIRKHIQEKEELEKAQGPILVDAKPTRQSRKGKDDKPEPKKKTGLAGWLADLQARAEEMQKQAQRKKP
jgi:YidC/Oxa1 family membrane protein insertase